ncbi:hypothetical protein M0R01_04000 [bacterium]|nr:hypothetical protein [bacterium]
MYCEHCENYLCEDCYTDHGCNNYVHDYCHKPNPIFRHYDIKTKSIVTGNYNPKVLYMGFELEVCFDSSSKMNSASESIFELSNSESLFYLKDDSSLSPYGFEIVSHPMDLKCLITGFPWRNIISILRRNGGTSYDSKLCGFHIHTSNKYFGKTDYDINNMKIKIVNFVEKNWTEMAKIAKRCKLLECIENGQAKTADGYCHFQTNTRCGFRYCQAKNINISKVIKNLNYNKVLSYYPRVTDLKNTHRNVSYEYGRIRNAAINLQPHDTTEFRLYRGTLKLQSIVKYLTLTNAIIDYVKQYDSIVKTSTFEEFIQKSSYTKNFKKYLKLLQIGEGE